MTQLLIALLTLVALSACTLDTASNVREGQLDATQTAIPFATATAFVVQQTLPPTQPTPILQTNPTACDRLRVTVGTDPGNTLRLREQPTNNATIVLLIPNNTVVTRVAGSQNVSADGYTWVNIQYTDPNGVIATGWAAQDAMRNQTTLAPMGC